MESSRVNVSSQWTGIWEKTSSAPSTLTPEQQTLADDLVQRHGKIRIAREKNGLHFYIPCPDCLKTDGEKELYSMHLAVNVDRYLNGHASSAQCMKTSRVFRIDELTMWEPLEKRGFQRGPERVADQALGSADLYESDERGNLVPKGPGETVPLSSLDYHHPAMTYLSSRQFTAAALEQQFHAAYCIKERDDLHYRRLLGGFKASPEGRIVFYIYQNGVRAGWQARILELDSDTHKFYYNARRNAWVKVMHREGPEFDWQPMEGFEDWDPAKYVMAHGARRNSILMGYDAALAFNVANQPVARWCFLCEGPLDAGRLGPPAIAVCGKSCSRNQADLLERAFEVIIVVRDNDKYGANLLTYVNEWLAAKRKVIDVPLPERFKDAGSLTPDDASIFRTIAMGKARLV